MRSITKLLMGLVVVGVIGRPSPAVAQPGVENRQPPGWVFTPSIAFGGSWDDNVLLVDPAGDSPGDYATPISPTATLDYRGRRTRFTGGYGGSLLVYRTLGELNSSEQRVRAFFQHRATERVTIFAQENFTSAPTTDILQLAGVPFYRIGARSNTAGGGVEAIVARHTTLRGTYLLNSVNFEDDARLGQQLDGGHAHQVLLTFARALSTHLTLGGEYELRRAILSEAEDRFNIHTGSATLRFHATPTIMLAGSVGVARLGPGLQHEGRTGPALGASIVRTGEYMTLSAAYRRSFIPSFGFGGTFQNEEWSGNVHVPFARNRAYADGSIAWFDNDPLADGPPSVRTVWLSGTIGYRVMRWLNLEGFYGLSQQDTQRVGGDLDRTQIGFRVVAAKPVRIH